MNLQIVAIALAPVLYLQGRAVLRNTPVLPEPPGPRHGITGTGATLKLMVLGDSAAAGVGADHQDDALLGNLVTRLARDFCVEWQLHAKTGATTAATLRYLESVEAEPVDLVVTSLGVNDVTRGVDCNVWLRQQAELRAMLKERFDSTLIVVSGLPPMHLFPALPQPLRWYFGRRASQFTSLIEQDLANREDATYLDVRFSEDVALAASDGFHPGPVLYAEWAKRIAELVLPRLRPNSLE